MFDILAQALSQAVGARLGGVGQDGRELLAAIAARVVLVAQRATQGGCDRLQHPVALVVAVGVVEFLEVVDVEHQHRQRQVVAARTVEFALQRLVEVTAVEQRGQAVGAGQAPQFLFEPLFFGHVAQQCRAAHQVALRVADARGVNAEYVLVIDQRVGSALFIRIVEPGLHQGGLVEQAQKAATHDLVLGFAQQHHRSRVDEHDVVGGVGDDDRFAGAVDDGRELVLLQSQSLVGLEQLGGHGVEAARHLREFVLAPHRHLLVEVAIGGASHGAGHFLDRLHDRAAHDDAGQRQRGQQRRPQHQQRGLACFLDVAVNAGKRGRELDHATDRVRLPVASVASRLVGDRRQDGECLLAPVIGREVAHRSFALDRFDQVKVVHRCQALFGFSGSWRKGFLAAPTIHVGYRLVVQEGPEAVDPDDVETLDIVDLL